MRRGFVFVIAACAAALSACAAQQPFADYDGEAYANFLIGRMADLRQDHRAAADRFTVALEGAPGDPELLEGALTASLAVGDMARARDLAAQARARRANVPYAHVVEAVGALSAGQWRRVNAALAHSDGGSAEELIERMLKTWAAVGAGDGMRAAGELAQINAPRPYDALLNYTRGLAFDADGDEAEARAAYDAATQSTLWIAPAAERYADLLARGGEAATGAALLRDREGRFGNPAQLVAAARVAAGGKAAPSPLTPARGAAIGLYGLGVIFMQESDSTNGLAALTLALMLDPSLDAARIAFADGQVGLGHTEEAAAALALLPENSPYIENARMLQALIAVHDGREDDALAIARANAEEGGGARAQRGLADFYRAFGRFADAEPIYTTLIDEDGAEPDWRLYFSRAVARAKLNRWPDAEADLQRALEISPDQPDVLNYLGYTWVDRGEHLEEGMALIERAVQMRPTSGAIIDSLGWAYYRQGDYERATQFLERAVSLSPADATLNDHLGDAYWQIGRRLEARFQWNRALSLDVEADQRAGIEAKVEAGLSSAPETRSANR